MTKATKAAQSATKAGEAATKADAAATKAAMAQAAQKALEGADSADDAASADAGNADGRSDRSPDRASDRSPDRASDRSRAAMEAATVLIDGRRYMRDGRGRLTPLALVRPQDQLMDEMVRIIVGHAEELSAQIARFRGHTMDDISAFDALLEAEYGGHSRRSVKGNRTYLSYDGCFKVQVQIAERIAFGPELQVARELVDHCIGEWSASANDEIRALVNHAFQADREGEISRGAIYSLLRLDIDDERWKKAMGALRDAMRIVGSKSYVRVYRRSDPEAAWEPVTIDLAKAS